MKFYKKFLITVETPKAEALGVSNALRANVLRMMFNGGLLEGRLIEGKELLAINVSPTLDGLQCLEWIREILRNG